MNMPLSCTCSGASMKALLAAGLVFVSTSMMAASAKPSPVRAIQATGYNLAFVDADARRVIDAVLGSMLSVDYSVDSGVQGNLTLRTSEPVARDALLSLLETALKPLGAVILIDGKSYKVVPIANAKVRAPLIAGSLDGDEGEVLPSTPGYASEAISLKHASAREITRLLQQFLGKEIVSGTNNTLNQVVITGTADERQAARKLVARFDVDTLADMNFEMYRLDNVDASSLLAELERIFQPPYDIIGSRVRIIPLPRLRSVLAIAGDRSDLARIEPWIRRLDTGAAGKRKLYNYPVQNGRAKDLASALQLVLGMSGGGGSVTPSSPVQTRRAANRRINAFSELRGLLGTMDPGERCIDDSFTLWSGLAMPRSGHMSDELARALGQAAGASPAQAEVGAALRLRVSLPGRPVLMMVVRPTGLRDQPVSVNAWDYSSYCGSADHDPYSEPQN